jgi:predicted DNA-binding transcriptional regulator AlpA
MVDTVPTNGQKLVKEKQAADMLSVAPRTLRNWRTRGGGPRFVKISGRCIRYRVADLNEWTKARTKRSTSDLGILPFEI